MYALNRTRGALAKALAALKIPVVVGTVANCVIILEIEPSRSRQHKSFNVET